MAYSRVLVPVDFSGHAITAAKLATAIARRSSASVTLLHVDHLPDVAKRLAERMPFDVWEAYIAERNDVLQRMLSDARVELGDDDRIHTALARNGTGPVIDEYARKHDVDLIVMGSHGIDSTGRFLLGSVAACVAAAAPCPVLITRTQHHDRLPISGAFRRPLVAIDYCPYSEAATSVVRDIAARDARVDLLHAWAPRASWLLGARPLPDELDRALEREHDELEERLARIADSANLAGLATSTVVEQGRAADVLLDRLDHGDYDVVLLGARKRAGDRVPVLGSVAERLLHRSPAPVVIIGDGAAPAPH